MPELFVLSGGSVGRSFPIRGVAVIGRAPGCDIRLSETSISREHARSEPDGGGWVVVDLGSRNGVKLEGRRIKERAALVDMQELVVGDVALRFRIDEKEPTPSPATPPSPAGPEPPPEEPAFELEEQIELQAKQPAETPPAVSPEFTPRERERARILAESRPAGLFSSDLSQWPLPLRWGGYLLVLVAMGALFYGAFVLITTVRGG